MEKCNALGPLSMFALMMLGLLGWGAYEVGRKSGIKNQYTRTAIVFNFPENAYQSIKLGKQTSKKSPSVKPGAASLIWWQMKRLNYGSHIH